MNKIMKKMRCLLILALVVLVAGMTVYGIFGFNNTVDYKNSYELKVSVDQNIDKAKTTLKETTDKFLADNGLKDCGYAFQEMDEGATLIYKFKEDVTEKVATLSTKIDDALAADSLVGVSSEVEVGMLKERGNFQMEWVLLAVGIAVVAIFIYELIMEKLSGAVAVICSAILSYVMFIAIMAITRIPAVDFVSALSAFAFAFGALLSASSVNAYKKKRKGAESDNLTSAEVVLSIEKSEKKKYLIALVVSLVAALAVIALLVPYMMTVGAQIAVAGVSAVFSSYFLTPIIWAAIKGNK